MGPQQNVSLASPSDNKARSRRQASPDPSVRSCALSALLRGDGDALALGDDDAHLWVLTTDADVLESTLQICVEVLSVDERRRHERFVDAQRGRRFALAHTLLRAVLSRYHPITARDWIFATPEDGRPELVVERSARPLRFNLSHTPGLCACVVTRRADCGVDVEQRGRVEEPLAVAPKILAPPELRELDALPAEARRDFFERAWVLKEAYLKARGCGLRLEPTSFELHADADNKISFAPPTGDRARDWQFRFVEPTPRHHLALALRRLGACNFEIATHLVRG